MRYDDCVLSYFDSKIAVDIYAVIVPRGPHKWHANQRARKRVTERCESGKG